MVFLGHTQMVKYLRQLPDGKLVSAGFDRQLKVWVIEEATCIRDIRVHLYDVDHLAIHPDGQSIVSSSYNPDSNCIHVTALDKEALPEDDDEVCLHHRALGVDSVDKLHECAAFLYGKQCYEKAISVCERGLKSNPDDVNLISMCEKSAQALEALEAQTAKQGGD